MLKEEPSYTSLLNLISAERTRQKSHERLFPLLRDKYQEQQKKKKPKDHSLIVAKKHTVETFMAYMKPNPKPPESEEVSRNVKPGVAESRSLQGRIKRKLVNKFEDPDSLRSYLSNQVHLQMQSRHEEIINKYKRLSERVKMGDSMDRGNTSSGVSSTGQSSETPRISNLPIISRNK